VVAGTGHRRQRAKRIRRGKARAIAADGTLVAVVRAPTIARIADTVPR
jgi:hypothetical protein